jgi:hypothetical protein
LKTHIFAITQLIKNRHEEVEENSFKNNIYQFHGKKQKNRLQQSSEVTPYFCLQISWDDALIGRERNSPLFNKYIIRNIIKMRFCFQLFRKYLNNGTLNNEKL